MRDHWLTFAEFGLHCLHNYGGCRWVGGRGHKPHRYWKKSQKKIRRENRQKGGRK